MIYSVFYIYGVFCIKCIQCILYSVSSEFSVFCIQCILYSVYFDDLFCLLRHNLDQRVFKDSLKIKIFECRFIKSRILMLLQCVWMKITGAKKMFKTLRKVQMRKGCNSKLGWGW